MKVFSLANFITLVAGVPITGLADGDDSISAKRLTNSASHKMGGLGDMMVSLSSDKSGEITIKLQQTSSSNSYLSKLEAAQALAAKNGGAVGIPIRAQDTYRNDVASGSVGYIQKPADMQRGEHGNNQEWVIVVENLDLIYGDIAAPMI